MTTLRVFECGPLHKQAAVARDLIVAGAGMGKRVYAHYPTPRIADIFSRFLFSDSHAAFKKYAAGAVVVQDCQILRCREAHAAGKDIDLSKWEAGAGLANLVTVGPRLAEPADMLVMVGPMGEVPPRPQIYSDIAWIYDALAGGPSSFYGKRWPPNVVRRMWASATNPNWRSTPEAEGCKTAFFSSCELRSVNDHISGTDLIAAAGPWRRLA